MTSLRIRPAVPDDVDRLIDVNRDAFADGLITLSVCPPSSPQFRPFWRQRLLRDVHNPHARFMVMEDADIEDPSLRVIAFGIWIPPKDGDDPDPDPDDDRPADSWPSDGDPAAAAAIFRDLAANHHKYTTDADGRPIPHWYLSLLATDPAHQRRGAAGRLLRWGADQADAAGVPCYLDATPAGYPVYASAAHGYREVGRGVYFGGKHEQVFMLREPRPRPPEAELPKA